jgi:hypothetical protein
MPFCEDDLILEAKIFSSDTKDLLPKTRFVQAYAKYLKIVKLAKEYDGRLGNSGRIRDLIKDCLNDMEMTIETKYGKRIKMKWSVIPPQSQCHSCQYGNKEFWNKIRFLKRNRVNSKCWKPWMHELANIRNHAIHQMTAFKMVKNSQDFSCTQFFLRAQTPNGDKTETNEEVLPYLKKTLDKIKKELEISENIEEFSK